MPRLYRAILDPFATDEQIVAAAKQSHSALVVLPIHVPAAKSLSTTIVIIGYPLGASKPVVKAIEATSGLKDGAAGVWIVPRWTTNLIASHEAMRDELLEIARALRAARREAQLGLVVDASWITDIESVETSLQIAREGACDVLIVLGNVCKEQIAHFPQLNDIPVVFGCDGAPADLDSVIGLKSLVTDGS